ncbi:hypothetical protein HBI56_124670 [Parastagonospora nodorum]|nr:hypothetical protein HBI10_147740 [Parastagonospora nodorum]KAH4020004.1 hypothetical protein HBI13_120890 [Parastagonospora nodorum]KAH4057017.1 hypothetical protein HBH49_040560 [Parastagonospora nodorum]KAH4076787.1 hypothetical protein HBH50_010390 [Parastagonospora nodorum]KAH4095732.1 hypothetical protein HBH48_047400 [Parastagonospora nodorum]
MSPCQRVMRSLRASVLPQCVQDILLEHADSTKEALYSRCSSAPESSLPSCLFRGVPEQRFM